VPQRDPSLPHQIIMYFLRGQVAVSCNCLCSRPGSGAYNAGWRPIAAQTVFPAEEALAAWRGWHAEHAISV
jgi:hypothetical protein